MPTLAITIRKIAAITAFSLSAVSQAHAQDPKGEGVSDLPQEWQVFVEENDLPVHKAFPVSNNVSGLLLRWGDDSTEMLYLLHEENIVVAGRLISKDGEQLTEQHETEYFWQDILNEVMTDLDKSEALWIAEGNPDAPYIYTFDDLNCPYCHQQYEALKPLVEAGHLQVRHILVGILQDDSSVLAAKVLNANDPAALFAKYQDNFGSPVAKSIVYEAAGDVKIDPRLGEAKNLMEKVGITGTPGVLVPMKDGSYGRYTGVMSAEKISDLFNIDTTFASK